MSNLIDQYTTGAFVLKVDGYDLKIKPQQGDKLKIHALDKKLSRLIKETSEDADQKIEETMEKKEEMEKKKLYDIMLRAVEKQMNEEISVIDPKNRAERVRVETLHKKQT